MDEDDRLDTEFGLNVKGTTAFPELNIGGTITAEAAGTASKTMYRVCIHCNTSLPVVSSDFENLQDIGVLVTSALPSAEIRLFTANDEVTLEYEDRVQLDFNITSADLITDLEAVGEYVRNTAIVNIIDSDCKYVLVIVIVRKSSCTRYNGTRGGVEIVIQYEAQPSTVWSIETRHECHYIPYSLISVLYRFIVLVGDSKAPGRSLASRSHAFAGEEKAWGIAYT